MTDKIRPIAPTDMLIVDDVTGVAFVASCIVTAFKKLIMSI